MTEAAKAEMEKAIALNAENNLFTKSAHRKALLDLGAVREGMPWRRGRAWGRPNTIARTKHQSDQTRRHASLAQHRRDTVGDTRVVFASPERTTP